MTVLRAIYISWKAAQDSVSLGTNSAWELCTCGLRVRVVIPWVENDHDAMLFVQERHLRKHPDEKAS